MNSIVINPIVILLPVILSLVLSRMDNPVTRWLKKYRSFTSVMIGVILLIQFNGQGAISMFPILFILIGLSYLYKDYKNLFGSHEAN